MSGTVAQNQVGAFTSPSNGDALDATVVKANDNATRTAHNTHDADPTIHVQSSVLASRPAASTAGRLWLTSDGLRMYYDTGSAWSEAAYLPLSGGTLTGGLTGTTASFSGTLGVTGVSTLSGGITVSGSGVSIAAGGLSITGQLVFGADNTYDVGSAAANRPRNVYVGGSLSVGGATTIGGSLALGGNTIGGAGAITFNTDNTSDIGASGANRPRAIYVAGTGTFGGAVSVGGTLGVTGATTLGVVSTGALTVGGALTLGGNAVSGSGAITFNTDNTSDIGASGASRPRAIYVAGNVTAGGTLIGAAANIIPSVVADGLASFGYSGAARAYIGNVATAGNVINGSAAGDMVLRNASGALRISVDNGATSLMTLSGTTTTVGGTIAHTGSSLGFFGATPHIKNTISGGITGTDAYAQAIGIVLQNLGLLTVNNTSGTIIVS